MKANKKTLITINPSIIFILAITAALLSAIIMIAPRAYDTSQKMDDNVVIKHKVWLAQNSVKEDHYSY